MTTILSQIGLVIFLCFSLSLTAQQAKTHFFMAESETCTEDTIIVKVQVSDFQFIAGFQWGLVWNEESLTPFAVSSSILPAEELDYQYLKIKNRLNVFWSSTTVQPLQLPDSTVILHLHFTTRQTIDQLLFDFVKNPLDQTAPIVAQYDAATMEIKELEPMLGGQQIWQNVNPQLQAHLTLDAKNCVAEKPTLRVDTTWGGTPPYLYALNEEPFMITPVFSDLAPGVYFLHIQDIMGCSLDSTVVVEPSVQTELQLFTSVTSITKGDTISLTFTTHPERSFQSVTWTNDHLPICINCTTIKATPQKSSWYQVEVEFGNRCKIVDSVLVTVNDPLEVYAPNAFTPNGDGVNDVFMLYGAKDWMLRNLRILDRWGSEVFLRQTLHCNVHAEGWDGTKHEALVPAGSYYWTVEAFLGKEGRSKVMYGCVQVFRE